MYYTNDGSKVGLLFCVIPSVLYSTLCSPEVSKGSYLVILKSKETILKSVNAYPSITLKRKPLPRDKVSQDLLQ
jgi:hypothetical protein